MTWPDDASLFHLIREKLFTAAVGDVLDAMGLRRQFLPPAIQPLHPDMVVLGRAMPVLEADCFDDAGFGLMLHALDDLKPNEVYIASGGTPRYALWGELMSVRAIKCGAAGAVVDGYSRDTRGVLALGFPTFSHGSYAQDQGPRGKVIDYGIPIQMGQVRICPGDIVFGDLDGVCVVPRAAEQDVMAAAFDKARKEKVVRKALEEGMPSKEAFATFGIL